MIVTRPKGWTAREEIASRFGEEAASSLPDGYHWTTDVNGFITIRATTPELPALTVRVDPVSAKLDIIPVGKAIAPKFVPGKPGH